MGRGRGPISGVLEGLGTWGAQEECDIGLLGPWTGRGRSLV